MAWRIGVETVANSGWYSYQKDKDISIAPDTVTEEIAKALSDAIEAANEEKEAEYTADSWKAYAEAVEEAKALVNKENATNTEYLVAIQTIEEAKAGLNWAKFINAEKKEEMEKMAQTDESLKKAYDRILELSADEEKRLEYEAREKALRDYNSQMKSNWNAGVKEGYKLGIIEGHKAGIAEAIIKIYQQLGKTKEEIEQILMEEMQMEEEEARKKVEELWKRE